MSVMLFKLRRVEEDEAEDIRALLDAHDFEYYETDNGRWGLGYAAIWLHDNKRFEEGTALIAEYQQQRFESARAAYLELCEKGEQATLWTMIQDKPMQILLALFGMLVVVLFALSPFVFL